MNFADKLIEAILEKKSYLCVGLDPQLRYFPPHLLKYCSDQDSYGMEASAEAILQFNIAIINATIEHTSCYKPQMAFYEKYGRYGIVAFEETVKYLHSLETLVIEDAKREDGGDTADAYADGHLGSVEVIDATGNLYHVKSAFDVDAITITAWIDRPVLDPFVKVATESGKGIFVLAKTSFKPTSRFQDMEDKGGEKGWIKMVKAVKEVGYPHKGENGYSPIGVVMGATYPEEAVIMQKYLPYAFKLIPGFSYQGGTAENAVVSFNEDGFGGIVNDSRGINNAWDKKFKSDFACDPRYFTSASLKESKKAKNALNKAVLKKNGSLPWNKVV